MTETLTLKDVQGHFIKTLVGCIATSLAIALATAFSFYYNTTAAMNTLNANQVEMKKTLDVHTDQINKATNGMGMSAFQQQAFEKRLTSIEDSQKEIYQILIQINSNIKNQ